jgi:hypothetical protein
MDPVGITNACTNVVVPKRSRMMVTVHSRLLGFRSFVGYDDLLLTHDKTIVTKSAPRVCADSGSEHNL